MPGVRVPGILFLLIARVRESSPSCRDSTSNRERFVKLSPLAVSLCPRSIDPCSVLLNAFYCRPHFVKRRFIVVHLLPNIVDHHRRLDRVHRRRS